MTKLFARGLSGEIARFKKLAAHARALVLSIFFQTLTEPIFGVFVNAFLWRETHNLYLIALYNLAIFFGLPFGFYLDSMLFRSVTLSHLYTFGIVGNGLAVVVAVFFLSPTAGVLFLYGFMRGFFAGMYWGARHLYQLYLVHDGERNYAFSVVNAFSSLAKFAVPIAAGWFIVAGERIGWYTPRQAYELLAVLCLLVLALSGRAMLRSGTDGIHGGKFFSRLTTPLWQSVRLMSFLTGMSDGLRTFIPPLMILLLVGKEGVLGSVISLSAVAGALAIYAVGRLSSTRERTTLAGIAIGGLIGGSLLFGWFYSPTTAVLYTIIAGFCVELFSIGHDGILYHAIERDDGEAGNLNFARICDREMFLDVGRVTAILIFIWFVGIVSSATALRVTPLATELIQLPLLFLFPRIVRQGTMAHV